MTTFESEEIFEPFEQIGMPTKKGGSDLKQFHFADYFLIVHDQATKKIFVYIARSASHAPYFVEKG